MIYMVRASDRSKKKVKFCRIFRDKFSQKWLVLWEICSNFGGKIGGKMISKKRLISWEFSWHDLTNIFNEKRH